MNKVDSTFAIVVKDVQKSFRIPLEASGGLKQKLINQIKGRKGYREFTPLNDISFSIKKGEFFGIVGRNGSGKSTLLKIIANIYSPEKGSIQVNGALVPFIELGVGFNPELTGRENIFLNGALLGFSHREVQDMYEEIVGFAELHDFMEERLKNYSSGMQVRLAFSIAIRAKSDILLLDEILAVGDEAFQKKCIDYFYKIKKTGQTVVLVTHDMTNVERFCDRALVLHDSKIVGIYKPAKAKLIYEQLNRKPSDSHDDEFKVDQRWGTKAAEFKSVTVNHSNHVSSTIKQGQPVVIDIELKSDIPKKVIIGLAIYDESGLVMAGPNSEKNNFLTTDKISYTIPSLPLNPGNYLLRVALYAKDHTEEYDHIEEAASFEVVAEDGPHYGKINLFGVWTSGKKEFNHDDKK